MRFLKQYPALITAGLMAGLIALWAVYALLEVLFGGE